ncbi:MAG: zf-HC2 domain-containing protein, partial [Eudoraea sp.]|nr:zf-HC2 domain-containing protein [Eudoraea sp.]
MKRDHITEILVDYLDGVLKPDLHKKAEEHLSSCKSCRSDLEETRQMLKAFREEENILPSGQLKTNFYKMLEEEKQKSSLFVPAVKNNTWVSGILKIAAGIALLIGAFTLGKLQEQQDSRKTIALLEDKSSAIKETAMLSLMENQSASKRIKGVHFIEEIAEPDEAIISALAERMLLDQNTNVRLS